MNRIRHYLLSFCLLTTALISGCDDTVEPPQEERIVYHEFYASGHDVAPLFRAHPLLVDSIFVRLRAETPNVLAPDVVSYRIYIETFTHNHTRKKILTGKDQFDWGAVYQRIDNGLEGIVSFTTTNATEDNRDVQLIGIYKKEGGALKLEYVYGANEWPSPPDAEIGFGSTADGGYGENNIHFLNKIIVGE